MWGPVAGGQGAEYMVALAQEIVHAAQDQLALDLEPGQRVIYSAPDGSELGASVADLHTSRWCAPVWLCDTKQGCGMHNGASLLPDLLADGNLDVEFCGIVKQHHQLVHVKLSWL